MKITLNYDYDRDYIGLVKPTKVSTNFDPDVIAIHWGGYTDPGDGNIAYEMNILRGWQRYHMRSRGWSDIAYNAAVGQSGTVYELRGENRPGATKYHNDHVYAIVWIGGSGYTPSPEAYAAMAKIIADNPTVDVSYHRKFRPTACPGDDWAAWVDDEQYKDVEPATVPPTSEVYNMVTIRQGDGYISKGTEQFKQTVRAAQIMLAAAGFADSRTVDGVCGADGVFGPGTYAAVTAYQRSTGTLKVDGVVGPATWQSLTGV